MSQKKYPLLVACALLFGACSNTNNEGSLENYPSDGLVRINTTVSDLSLNDLNSTRANDYGGTDLSLSINYTTNGNASGFDNAKFTKSSDAWVPDANEKYYWQSFDATANIYAYAPYVGDKDDDIAAIPFSVKQNQNQASVGLTSSDLMGYTQEGFVPYKALTATKLDILLKHKLSKLTLALTLNNEFGQGATINKVTLNGTKLDVTYDAKSATAAIAANSTSAPISMHKVEGKAMTYEAILVPQTLVTGTNMVTVTFDGGQQCSYTIEAGDGHKFESGNAYTMDLSVGKNKIEFGGINVADWETGGSANGEVSALDIQYVSFTGTLKFKMGDNAGNSDEKPVHDVTLRAFKMSNKEITNAQYCLFLNANKIGSDGKWKLAEPVELKDQILIYDSKDNGRSNWGVNWNVNKWVPAPGYDKFPVIYVTWFGAKAFATWVGGDLPTEAQWEYACRGGGTTKWSCGDDEAILGNYAWYKANNSPSGTKAVGTKAANKYGLYDMHGNVMEWCNDWYDRNYYGESPENDPTGPSSGTSTYRVFRGGRWIGDASNCRSAYRGGNFNPTTYNNNTGFRVVVCSLP